MTAPADEPVIVRLEETTWERHGKKIIFGALGAALGIVAFALLTYGVARRQAAAAAAYAEAKMSTDFSRVAREFSGTPVAGDALIRLAASHRASGELEQEFTALTELLTKYPKHPMRSLALIALGKNQRARGQGTQAITTFQQVLTERPRGEVASMAALNAGLVSLEMGQQKEAYSYFQQAASLQFDSLPARQAALEMRLLEASGVSAPGTSSPASSEWNVEENKNSSTIENTSSESALPHRGTAAEVSGDHQP